jgi:hypothetical protein
VAWLHMNREAFLAEDNWCGSYYELCLELGPTGDDERLIDAVTSLWAHPHLRGPWIERGLFDRPPSPKPAAGGHVSPLWGVIALSSGQQLGCVTHVVREANGSDWLDLCIPSGMLELAFNIQYPLEYQTNTWMRAIDHDFAQIAESVFLACPFVLGMIGEEVSGTRHGNELSAEDCPSVPLFLPSTLWSSLGLTRPHRMGVPGLICVDSPPSE